MNLRMIISTLMICGLLAVETGCAPTKVTTDSMYAGSLPAPDQILVYDLAVSPEEVTLDKGVGAQIVAAAKKEPRSEQERAIGRQMADAFSRALVKELQGMGFLADRKIGPVSPGETALMVKGQYLSIDEGNQSERVWVGLGMGRSDVRANIQLMENLPNSNIPVLVQNLIGDAKSGFKPGMAESLGAGAVAGKAGEAAAVGGVLTVGSEAFMANVEADAKRMAKHVGKQIKDLYSARGWPRM